MPRTREATNSAQWSSRFPQKALETLAADRVLTRAEIDQYQGFTFDPGGGARNLDLPAEEVSAGAVLMIANAADAAEVITIRNDAGGTLATPTQAEAALVWCNGTSWFGLVGASS